MFFIKKIGAGSGVAHFQLFLYGRFHRRVDVQSDCAGRAEVHPRPLESAGCGHRHPVHRRHRPRGDEIRLDSHQSHHHPSDARSADSQRYFLSKNCNGVPYINCLFFFLLISSVEIVENGQRDPLTAGHCDAGSASSRQPWPPLLLALLHFRCPRCRIVWSPR